MRHRLASLAPTFIVLGGGLVPVLAGPVSPSAAAERPAYATATYAKRVLTIHGTSAGQDMSVVRKGRKVLVLVDGVKVSLPRGYKNSRTREIRILGLAGDDHLSIDSTGGSMPAVALIGGKGDDTLVGGPQDDVLDGGKGDDELRAGAGGTDVLEGGIGADRYEIDADLAGQAVIDEPDADGPDHLSFASTESHDVRMDLEPLGPQQQVSTAYAITLPHGGLEELTGGDGDDTLKGTSRTDRLHGGPGDDFLSQPWGSGDDDVMYGDDGDDTFELFVACSCHMGSARLEDSSGNDTVSFRYSGALISFDLGVADWQAVSTGFDLQLASATAFENAIGGDRDNLVGTGQPNRLDGWAGSDTLTGNGGADTFVYAYFDPWYANVGGDDTVTDFTAGTDTVDIGTGLSIKSGLGTETVTVWDGTLVAGTLTASNGHVWTAEDFT